MVKNNYNRTDLINSNPIVFIKKFKILNFSAKKQAMKQAMNEVQQIYFLGKAIIDSCVKIL